MGELKGWRIRLEELRTGLLQIVQLHLGRSSFPKVWFCLVTTTTYRASVKTGRESWLGYAKQWHREIVEQNARN